MSPFDRLLYWRPTQELIFAWRFWTALRSAGHADWRDRVAWASGVLMTRALVASGNVLPFSIEVTERNLARVNRSPWGEA
jgi:hypothetical protein